jgi:hypothetical protein
VLVERETALMEQLWVEASSLAASRLVLVEARAALVRAAHNRRITSTGFASAKAIVEALLREVHLVEPEPKIVVHAADLAERHRLRALDAVHLASALALGDPEVVVATWDIDLGTAASAEGLALAA